MKIKLKSATRINCKSLANNTTSQIFLLFLQAFFAFTSSKRNTIITIREKEIKFKDFLWTYVNSRNSRDFEYLWTILSLHHAGFIDFIIVHDRVLKLAAFTTSCYLKLLKNSKPILMISFSKFAVYRGQLNRKDVKIICIPFLTSHLFLY